MKRLMLVLALSACGFAQQPTLSEYHFVVDPQVMAAMGLPPMNAGGSAVEVFIDTTNPSTTAFRVTVKYVNHDGSTGSQVILVERAPINRTLAWFPSKDAKAVTSVLVEEQSTFHAQEFLGN